MSQLGRVILSLGVVLVILGLILTAADRIPLLGKLGRLPGDIHIKSGSVQVYIPLTTCILLSLVLTLIIRLFMR